MKLVINNILVLGQRQAFGGPVGLHLRGTLHRLDVVLVSCMLYATWNLT